MSSPLKDLLPSNRADEPIWSLLIVELLLLVVAKFVLPVGSMQEATYLGLTILTAALAIARPYWGLLAMVASLPINSLIPLLNHSTSILPIIGLSTLVGFVLVMFLEGSKSLDVNNVHYLAIAFIIWVGISNPSHALDFGSTVWIGNFAKLALLLFLTSQLVRSRHQLVRLATAFVLTAAISSLAAIHQVHFGIDSATSIRATGLATSPNGAARIFVLASIFLAYLSHTSISKLRAVIYVGAAAVLLQGIVATVSRTGLLLYVIGFVIVFLYSIHQKQKTRLILLLTIVPTLFFFLPDEYWRIVFGIPSSISDGTDSVGFRYMQWKTAFEIWQDNWFRGIGIGQFINVAPFYAIGLAPYYGLNYAPHSLFYGVLAELGIVGLIGFLCMFVSALGIAWAKSGSIRESILEKFVLTAALLVSLSAGLTGDVQYDPFLWLFMGLAAGWKEPASIAIARLDYLKRTSISRVKLVTAQINRF